LAREAMPPRRGRGRARRKCGCPLDPTAATVAPWRRHTSSSAISGSERPPSPRGSPSASRAYCCPGGAIPPPLHRCHAIEEERLRQRPHRRQQANVDWTPFPSVTRIAYEPKASITARPADSQRDRAVGLCGRDHHSCIAHPLAPKMASLGPSAASTTVAAEPQTRCPKVVGVEGLEPPATCASCRCSTT
jgi:hypothetical protein